MDLPRLGLPDGGAARLRILAPTRYPWRFNGPRRSRHHISNRAFIPFNRISPKIEGVTVFNPLPARRFDLVHAFNRIPLGRSPFVIGFESHLPRAFGLEGTALFRGLTALLASPRCRGIVAISDHAAAIFRDQHAGGPHGATLLAKLSRRYPNVVPTQGRAAKGDLPLRVAFVGNHFARKGGCVTVRVAEMALAARLPVRFDLVSTLEVGGSIWTDPVDRAFFTSYLRLLDLPNVRLQRQMSNPDIHALLGRSHLSLLPTLGDTCGYGAIESLVNGTPVVVTSQGALPEFVAHEKNGFLLPIETDAQRQWVHLGAPDRGSGRFERIFAEEVERLARDVFRIIAMLVDAPETITAMSNNAWRSARRLFDAEEATRFWDDYYVEAVRNAA